VKCRYVASLQYLQDYFSGVVKNRIREICGYILCVFACLAIALATADDFVAKALAFFFFFVNITLLRFIL